MSEKNMINWFEIAVKDFDRACKFYGEIMGVSIEKAKMGPFDMGFFPASEGKVSGALLAGEGYEPSMDGVVVYLNADPDLAVALAKVEAAGGKIIVPKTQITPEYGYFAFFLDTEGNKIGLHSNS